MSSKLANCAVDLSPGRYRIN